MKKIKINKWELKVDIEETKKAYSQITESSADVCSCEDCKNFVKVREKSLYPKEAVKLFTKVGINPLRETELYSLGFQSNGLFRYSGWVHFIGQIITGPESELLEYKDDRGEVRQILFTQISETFSISIRSRIDLAFEPFQITTKPVLQLEFLVDIPWLL
jgi:hypothetical protein